jgi:IS30 family transposase
MNQLTVAQRYQIQVLLEGGLSVKRISEKVSVHRSTIYRELHRNSMQGIYLASQAQSIHQSRNKGQKNKMVGAVAARIGRH